MQCALTRHASTQYNTPQMRIGIYGGTFNPIHNGHVALAEAFLKQAKLDEVWFVVSPQNPFKINVKLLDDHLRLKMVQEVLKDKHRLIASDYEFHLPKPSYTWDTLQSLSKDFPCHQFTLLIGGDNWKAFDKWYHYEDILANYQIAVYPRIGDGIEENVLPKNVRLLKTKLINISSTEIRNRVKANEPITGMVPAIIEKQVREAYKALSG